MEKMKNSGPYSSYMRRKPVDSCPERPTEIYKAEAAREAKVKLSR